MESPVFLVGSVRSGTTLLAVVLGHHPQIAFTGEFEWPWDFPAEDLESYLDWVETEKHFIAHGIKLPGRCSHRELVASFWEQMARGVTKPIIGAQVHRHYAEAFEQWPNAKFIHIIRDGRDVAASMIKLGWAGNGYVAGEAWRNSIEEWQRLERIVPESQRIQVSFEDFVRTPRIELRRICSFLGVEFAEEMLRHRHRAYGPMDAKEAFKWRATMSPRMVRQVEAGAWRALEAARYELVNGEVEVSALRDWWLRTDNRIRHLLARAKIYGAGLYLLDLFARRSGLRALASYTRLALNDVEMARRQH